MATRPKALKFTGMYRDFGNGKIEPDRFFNGIPARDLDEADIAELTDDQLKDAMGGRDPLYVEPKADVKSKVDEQPVKSP